MSYLDSPIGFCELEHAIVLTDQTQAQCGLEHACPPGRICPLHGFFAGIAEAALPEGILDAYQRASTHTGGRTNKPL